MHLYYKMKKENSSQKFIFFLDLKYFEKKNEVFVEIISLDLHNEMSPFDIKMFNLWVDLIEHVSLFCYNRKDNLKK